MSKTKHERAMAQLTKRLVVNCVRNTMLEGFHKGRPPETKTGDYSDVTIIDGHGAEIPWTEAQFISQDEMKALMKQIVNRLYTSLLKGDEPDCAEFLARHDYSIGLWDAPKIDDNMMEQLDYIEKTKALSKKP